MFYGDTGGSSQIISTFLSTVSKRWGRCRLNFVHIPEETVKITMAIFSCTFKSEISLEKVGILLLVSYLRGRNAACLVIQLIYLPPILAKWNLRACVICIVWSERKTGCTVAGGFFSFFALQTPLSPSISNTFTAKSLIHICTKRNYYTDSTGKSTGALGILPWLKALLLTFVDLSPRKSLIFSLVAVEEEINFQF